MPAAGRSPRFLFQSTLPLRGATSGEVPSNQRGREFQSTLPFAGSDLQIKGLSAGPLTFQSTLPLRGATCLSVRSCRSRLISIHTPLAGSDKNSGSHDVAFQLISIHTPLAGSDKAQAALAAAIKFQSTLPLRGATGTGIDGKTTLKFQSTLPLRGATRSPLRITRNR